MVFPSKSRIGNGQNLKKRHQLAGKNAWKRAEKPAKKPQFFRNRNIPLTEEERAEFTELLKRERINRTAWFQHCGRFRGTMKTRASSRYSKRRQWGRIMAMDHAFREVKLKELRNKQRS
ncbi:hypothetical protein MMC14_008107 [Varicellaria rhodocarpa]|nr:hypothetical protein [Varicellaria rhodocarpa]